MENQSDIAPTEEGTPGPRRFHPLWNGEEGRPRAFWRLLFQLVITLPLLVLFNSVAQVGVSLLTGPVERLGIPADEFTIVGGFMALGAAAMASVLIAVRVMDRRPMADLGLHLDRRWWADFLFGLGLGAALMGAIFLIEWRLGWLEVTGTFRTGGGPFAVAILVPIALYSWVALYEEVTSRGYLLTNLAEGFRLRPGWARGAVLVAWLLSSVVFGLLHAANPNATVVSTLSLMFAGLLLGLGYVLTGNLGTPIGLHLTWNLFQGSIFGFPVSGTVLTPTSLIAISQGGPTLWTGGEFGPEAGLLGLGASALGGVLTLLYVRLSRGEARIHTPIAEPPPAPASPPTPPA